MQRIVFFSPPPPRAWEAEIHQVKLSPAGRCRDRENFAYWISPFKWEFCQKKMRGRPTRVLCSKQRLLDLLFFGVIGVVVEGAVAANNQPSEPSIMSCHQAGCSNRMVFICKGNRLGSNLTWSLTKLHWHHKPNACLLREVKWHFQRSCFPINA